MHLLIVQSMKLHSSSTPYLSLPKQLHGKFVWRGFQFPPVGPFSRWKGGKGEGGEMESLAASRVHKSLDSENSERCVKRINLVGAGGFDAVKGNVTWTCFDVKRECHLDLLCLMRLKGMSPGLALMLKGNVTWTCFDALKGNVTWTCFDAITQ